jgi:hypothetical protein
MLIVIVSEAAKKSSLLGAVLASVPLISVFAIVWLYIDTKSVEKVSALSSSVFWMVLPSLTLFILLPILLAKGVNFYLSIGMAILATVSCYLAMIQVLGIFGIKL